MKIDSIMVGPIMTNCYLLSDETAGVCALRIAVHSADPRSL